MLGAVINLFQGKVAFAMCSNGPREKAAARRYSGTFGERQVEVVVLIFNFPLPLFFVNLACCSTYEIT